MPPRPGRPAGAMGRGTRDETFPERSSIRTKSEHRYSNSTGPLKAYPVTALADKTLINLSFAREAPGLTAVASLLLPSGRGANYCRRFPQNLFSYI